MPFFWQTITPYVKILKRQLTILSSYALQPINIAPYRQLPLLHMCFLYSLYENMDQLISWVPDRDKIEELIRLFTWLILYILKAQNYKLFKGCKPSPKETLEVAILESEAWFLANLSPWQRSTSFHLSNRIYGSWKKMIPPAMWVGASHLSLNLIAWFGLLVA